MSADNRHTIEVTGSTLREVSQAALEAFDAFFAREVEWNVVQMDTHAEITEARNGVGEVIVRRVATWHARVTAEAHDVAIGAQRAKPAMLFKPLGQ